MSPNNLIVIHLRDNVGILKQDLTEGELIGCEDHLILFTTGRRSVIGSVISPVINICRNPKSY